jgi:hypothetical protein
MPVTVMFDSRGDARRFLPQIATDAGALPRAWARPLATGTPDGSSGVALTGAEARELHDRGVAVLPVFMTCGLHAATYSGGEDDASRAVALAETVGVPRGVYIVLALRGGVPVVPAYFEGWADVMRASPYGGAGIAYGDFPAWVGAFVQARLANGNVRRMGLWTRRLLRRSSRLPWPRWDPRAPAVSHDVVWAWKFQRCSRARIGASLLRLPLPSFGPRPEGLWEPAVPRVEVRRGVDRLS